MELFDLFKKKDVIKVQTDTICNHSDALPNSIFCPMCGAAIERIFQILDCFTNIKIITLPITLQGDFDVLVELKYFIWYN